MAAKKKKRKQNKPHGHYCKVCGEHKANEKFSGKGHAAHICKKCAALPVAKRNEEMMLRKIENMAFRWLSKTEIKWLRSKMNDSRTEVRDAARQAYDMKFPNYERDIAAITAIDIYVPFSDLDEAQRAETIERLEELIGDFFMDADYLPTDEDRDEILAELCGDMSDMLNEWEPEPYDPASEHDPRFDFGAEVSIDERIALMQAILDADAEDFDPYAEPEEPEPPPRKGLLADAALKAVFDCIIADAAADAEADGIPYPTFMETLTVAETERLTIRQFYKTDMDALCAIMSKPEVMYAWEAGFHKREVRKWLNTQYTRYHKDGYGYFAVTFKDSGKLIGQAGLMKSDLNGDTIVEIGYIFDNSVWGQGYAIEAARACVELAFERFGLDRLYATIRPENAASVRLAVKLGMRRIGEVVKIHKDKEMPHDVYMLEKHEIEEINA